jgi:hypothetical protein
MKRLVSDENFSGPILSGLMRRDAEIDVVRVVDAALSGVRDTALLGWAAANKRVILSHDRKTMLPDAARRIAAGDSMEGLILVGQNCPINQAIEEILLNLECYAEEGWQNRIVTIPL